MVNGQLSIVKDFMLNGVDGLFIFRLGLEPLFHGATGVKHCSMVFAANVQAYLCGTHISVLLEEVHRYLSGSDDVGFA